MSQQIPIETIEAAKLAADTLKQLITISSALLALSVTFVKELLARVGGGRRGMLIGSWCFSLVCIGSSIWALHAITGTMAKLSSNPAGIYGANVSIPAAISMVTFLCALVCFAIFGVQGLNRFFATNSEGINHNPQSNEDHEKS